MPEPIILAIITGVVTILTALIGKLTFDMSKTKKAAVKTEHSINNRDTPLSDRLDKVGEAAASALQAVNKVAETLEAHGHTLATHTKDLRGIDENVGLLKGADRDLQKSISSQRGELSEHIRDTSRWQPMLEELHAQYVGNKRN